MEKKNKKHSQVKQVGYAWPLFRKLPFSLLNIVHSCDMLI